jgi:hypothetical protein
VSSAILRVRMRHRQPRNRRNISQEVSDSMRLMSAGVLRFGYLAPDIVEAIAEGRLPRCMTLTDKPGTGFALALKSIGKCTLSSQRPRTSA